MLIISNFRYASRIPPLEEQVSKQKLNKTKERKKSHPLNSSQNPFQTIRGNFSLETRRRQPIHGSPSIHRITHTGSSPFIPSNKLYHRWYHHNAINRHGIDNDSSSEKEDTISPRGNKKKPETSAGQHPPPPPLFFPSARFGSI